MSFGFSASDFVALARLTFKLYNEFKEGPKQCQAFTKELHQFHFILRRFGDLLRDETIGGPNKSEIESCLTASKELIYIEICGASDVPIYVSVEHCQDPIVDLSPALAPTGPSIEVRLLKAWRRRWAERTFARRIPKLKQAVAAHISRLTAVSALITQSHQSTIKASQDRLETSQGRIKDSLDTYHIIETQSQARLTVASDRVEQSQARIEDMLQQILAPQRRPSPILSQSLDASSPEGRETWMNLGRLLRTEGITPQMIRENRDTLIMSMKTTLRKEELSSTHDSYHTAFESLPARSVHPADADDGTRSLNEYPHSQLPPMHILGSAPPSRATFTDEFLARHKGPGELLDKQENIDDGVQSLLAAMGTDQTDIEVNENVPEDEIYLEGLHESQAHTINSPMQFESDKTNQSSSSIAVESTTPHEMHVSYPCSPINTPVNWHEVVSRRPKSRYDLTWT